MLNKLRQSNNKGFTIIEVMIVLAIAGMIILVVLLAVPAVQRSGRNTAIKNDVGALAAGIADFSQNNNGASPTKFVAANGVVTLQNATITTGATAKLQGQTTVNGSSTGAAFAVRTLPTVADVSAGAIFVDSGESCKTVAATAPTKSSRAFAIYYWTESQGVAAGVDATTGVQNGAGLQSQCQDS